MPLRAKSGGGGASTYVKYLKSYEGMIRQQDLEYDATSEHIKCIFERLVSLGGKKKSENDKQPSTPTGMLTYLQIRRCLLRMGIGWDRSVPATSEGTVYDDDVSVLSFNSSSSLHSGLSGGSGKSDNIIASDAQLIMLLTALVEIEEKYRAYDDDKKKYDNHLDQGLFLPEFIQAYKLIIGGVQSLKDVPDHNDPAQSHLCNRLKERTLGMLKPFGPNASIYNDTSRGDEDDNSSKKAISGFSKCDIKNLLLSKDITLQKIVEDNELEVDALASSLEQLRLEEQRTRDALKRRRKQTRWVAFFLGGILIAGCITAEYRRREYTAQEIALGREAWRLADAKTIEQLNEKKRALEKKLTTMEGKMRYQINRNSDIEAKMQGIEKKIDDADMKSLVNKQENERCISSQVELNEDLRSEHSKKGGMDEELVWCRNRLRSQEMELNELQHTGSSTGGDDATKGHMNMNQGRKSLKRQMLRWKNEVQSLGQTWKNSDDRPVHLEMKYNRSIRRNVMLRQAYSALAALAVTALLQGLMPIVVKVLFSPKAVIVPPPPPSVLLANLQNRKAQMVLDGIFGSSVTFLLVKAFLTFL